MIELPCEQSRFRIGTKINKSQQKMIITSLVHRQHQQTLQTQQQQQVQQQRDYSLKMNSSINYVTKSTRPSETPANETEKTERNTKKLRSEPNGK